MICTATSLSDPEILGQAGMLQLHLSRLRPKQPLVWIILQIATQLETYGRYSVSQASIGQDRCFGMAILTVMKTKAVIAPAYTTSLGCCMLMMAAMMKVSSPSSVARI